MDNPKSARKQLRKLIPSLPDSLPQIKELLIEKSAILGPNIIKAAIKIESIELLELCLSHGMQLTPSDVSAIITFISTYSFKNFKVKPKKKYFVILKEASRQNITLSKKHAMRYYLFSLLMSQVFPPQKMQNCGDEILRMFIFLLKYHSCPMLEIANIPTLDRVLQWFTVVLDSLSNLEDLKLVTECKRLIKLHETLITNCTEICDFYSALSESYVLPQKRRSKIEVLTL